MTAYQVDPFTARGIAAARIGDRAEARRLFEFALRQDESNVVAWWWLAQSIEDAESRHKCLEHARGIASQSDQGLATYRALLQESGAPTLPSYRLVKDSKSVGTVCPIDTVALREGDTVAICPACGLAHHLECWECNAYHCGGYACEGSGIIDRSLPARVEAAAPRQATVVVDEAEVPNETPWQSREEQEAGFMGRLRQQAAAMMAATVLRQAVMAERATQARRQAEERARQEEQERQMALVRRVVTAFLVGLIPGTLLAIVAYRYSHSWLIALFTVYLTTSSIATATGHAFQASDRLTSVLYWLLPKVAAALIMIGAFERWGNGLIAVILAWAGGVLLTERLLRVRALYERRAFIVYGLLGITGLVVLRSVLASRG
jgi:hypothetical protein